MDAGRFDAVTRALRTGPSRRTLLGLLGMLGMLGGLGFQETEGRKRKKRKRRNKNKKNKKQKVVRNAFGCVDVGKFCTNADQCCSGICTGKKGKKTCLAHDAGGCTAGQQQQFCGGVDVICQSSAGFDGLCTTTTGNAGACAVAGDCFPCAKDTDCQPFCGPRAVCVVCNLGCADTGGTGCAGPDECTFPPS